MATRVRPLLAGEPAGEWQEFNTRETAEGAAKAFSEIVGILGYSADDITYEYEDV